MYRSEYSEKCIVSNLQLLLFCVVQTPKYFVLKICTVIVYSIENMHDFFQIYLKLLNMFYKIFKIMESLELRSQNNFPVFLLLCCCSSFAILFLFALFNFVNICPGSIGAALAASHQNSDRPAYSMFTLHGHFASLLIKPSQTRQIVRENCMSIRCWHCCSCIPPDKTHAHAS